MIINHRSKFTEDISGFWDNLAFTSPTGKSMASYSKTMPSIDASGARNLSETFSGYKNLKTIDIANTNACTNFRSMFYGCSSLTSVPQLDTSKGTNFESMFDGCTGLTSIPQLDTSNGTNFSDMFYICPSLTTLGTDSVTDADGNTVKPWQFKVSIDFGYCPLDKASIECVMNNIQTVTTTQTLTISKTSALNICGQTDRGYDYASDAHYLEMMSVCTGKGWKVAVNTSH